MTLTDKIHKRLRPYAKERGLLRKGRTYYTITEDTAYCFSIENHTFDIYVHFYLIPLYMREENHILTYGNLLNSLFFKKIPTLQKTAAEEEIDAWAAIVTGIVDSYVLPFFRQVDSPEKLLDFLALSWEAQKDYLFCPPEHRLRLKTYTLLYLHRQEEAREAVTVLREELDRVSNFRDRMRKILYTEAYNLEAMCGWTQAQLDAFFAESIAFTKEKCF